MHDMCQHVTMGDSHQSNQLKERPNHAITSCYPKIARVKMSALQPGHLIDCSRARVINEMLACQRLGKHI